MRRSRLVALSLLLVLGAAPPTRVAAQDQETVVTFVVPVGASPDRAFLVEVDDLRWQVGPIARSGLVRFPLDAIATVRIRRLDDCSIAALFTVAPGRCGDEDAPHWLYLAESPGAPMDHVSDDPRPFVRDPDGVMGPAWAEGFAADTRLPRDAVSTGIASGRATIWTSASAGRDAVFLELRDGRIERCPRAPHEIACG